MKKTLLLQTALVAAAGLMVAGAANAQTKETPVGVTVGGYYTSFYKVQDRDKAAQTDQSSQALGQDAEIHFNIRGVLDNGTVVGGRIELEGTTYSDQLDETYLFVERSDIGRLELGATDRVSTKMLYMAPTALPGHDTISQSEYAATNVQPGMRFTSADDNEGINLYTASNRYFGSKAGKGLQVGVSYVPNGCQDFANCGGGFSSTADSGQLSQQYQAAANYIESFGPVDVALFIGYNSVHIEGALGTGVTDARQAGWQAGAQFAYNLGDGGAIQFGGGYTNEDLGRTVSGGSGVMKDRKAYDLGLRYLTNGSKPGSIGIGIEYGARKDKLVTALTTGNEDELKFYAFGVTYQLASAVQTFAGVGVSDVDYADNSPSDPKQTFGVVGIGLRF
ncbi:porin [Ferrovibrio sp.]|uniref:porin n=1 Tax=Ferrovibrio sp. TaxID=1917215 RepID=UPI00311EB833